MHRKLSWVFSKSPFTEVIIEVYRGAVFQVSLITPGIKRELGGGGDLLFSITEKDRNPFNRGHANPPPKSF